MAECADNNDCVLSAVCGIFKSHCPCVIHTCVKNCEPFVCPFLYKFDGTCIYISLCNAVDLNLNLDCQVGVYILEHIIIRMHAVGPAPPFTAVLRLSSMMFCAHVS